LIKENDVAVLRVSRGAVVNCLKSCQRLEWMGQTAVAIRSAGARRVVDEPNLAGDSDLHRSVSGACVRGVMSRVSEGISPGETNRRIVSETAVRIDRDVVATSARAACT